MQVPKRGSWAGIGRALAGTYSLGARPREARYRRDSRGECSLDASRSSVFDHEVYQARVEAAEERSYDLIVMASDGRRGVSAVVPGQRGGRTWHSPLRLLTTQAV